MRKTQQETEEFSPWKMILIVGLVFIIILGIWYYTQQEEKEWGRISTKFCQNMSALYMGSHGEYITCGIYDSQYGFYDTKDFRVNMTKVRELYG
jgi:hypothetical protein